jgi:D-sedoheptulose 7-phosphate isomerase
VSADHVARGLRALAALAEATVRQSGAVADLARRYVGALEGGGTLFFAGNGGSAADAQHIAAEYVVRYLGHRQALPAVALTTDTSLLTAAGNDFGFEQVFARQIEALMDPGDLLMLHSTTGQSANLVAAARAAKERGASVVALLGRDGGELANLADAAVIVDSGDTSHIQEIHLALEHLIVELVEAKLCSR